MVGGESGARDPRDDAALLHAHTTGDPDAFAELVRRHRDRLWAVALRTIGDREEAADALQDALLSAYRAADRFRGDAAVTTWLHRIVVNACLDRLRRRQSRPTVPLPEVDRTPAPAVDRDTALVVQAALAQLPVEQRAALVLVDLQGYPVADAARILNVAEGTIKSRCARGRARLAVILGHLKTGGSAGSAGDSVTDSAHDCAAPAARNPGSRRDVPSRTGNASGATTVGKEGGS